MSKFRPIINKFSITTSAITNNFFFCALVVFLDMSSIKIDEIERFLDNIFLRIQVIRILKSKFFFES